MKNVQVVKIVNVFVMAVAAILFVSSYMQKDISAKGNEDTALKEAYSKMERAHFNSYTYGWESYYYAVNPEISGGVLGGKISDFDGDGNSELLVLKISGLNENDGEVSIYGKANLEMYEYTNSLVQLNDSTDYVTVLDSATDAGGMEFFTKGNYIALQCATQNNTFADGVTQSINVYTYNGNKFVNEISKNFSCSMLHLDADDNLNYLFKKIGFDKTAEYLMPNSFVDPYFTSGLNLAKIEAPVDLISELLITNNLDEISFEFAENMEEINNLLINNAKMNIVVNDFSSIDDAIDVIVNGNRLSLAVSPYIDNGITMVPMREIFEALGADVVYDPKTKVISVYKDNNEIEIKENNSFMILNGDVIELSVAVVNKNGHIMIPLNSISKLLGVSISSDLENKIINIIS